jgi:molybdate transport system permease protein
VREELRWALRRLRRETGLTTVLVTHDPAEAALLADEVLILVDGRVLQAGAQREVFARPASAAAARLLGVRNLLPGTVDAAGSLRVGETLVRSGAISAGTMPAGDSRIPVTWTVPPTSVEILAEGDIESCDAGVEVAARVVDVVHLGSSSEVLLTLTDSQRTHIAAVNHEILAITNNEPPRVGQACRLRFPATAITVWQDL